MSTTRTPAVNASATVSASQFLRATADGDLDTVERYLSQPDPELEVTTSKGHTALIVAAYFGHHKIFQLLVNSGANLEFKDGEGHKPIHYAAQEGRTEIVSDFIFFKVEVDPLTNKKSTPLHLAAVNNQTKTARLLIDAGANVNAVNDWGNTPLIQASSNGALEFAILLINEGAELDLVNEDGNSALMVALIKNKKDVAELLIQEGADTTIKNKEGKTALDLTTDDTLKQQLIQSAVNTEEQHLEALIKLRERRANRNYANIEIQQKVMQKLSDLSLRTASSNLRFVQDNLDKIARLDPLKSVLMDTANLVNVISSDFDKKSQEEFEQAAFQLRKIVAKLGKRSAASIVASFRDPTINAEIKQEAKSPLRMQSFFDSANSSAPASLNTSCKTSLNIGL